MYNLFYQSNYKKYSQIISFMAVPNHLLNSQDNYRKYYCGEDVRKMKNSSFKLLNLTIIMLLLYVLVFSASHASEQDPLWQKAMEIAAANANWVPGHVIHFEEVYSRIGLRQEFHRDSFGTSEA